MIEQLVLMRFQGRDLGDDVPPMVGHRLAVPGGFAVLDGGSRILGYQCSQALVFGVVDQVAVFLFLCALLAAPAPPRSFLLPSPPLFPLPGGV